MGVLIVGLIPVRLDEADALRTIEATPPEAVAERPPGRVLPRDGVALRATLLRRPLFSPDRRPLPPPAPVPEPVRNEPIPRLMGIVIDNTVRQAIFAGPAGQPARSVGEGERVGAYRVATIGTRQVELQGPNGRHILMPHPDPAARGGLALLARPAALIDPFRRETDNESDQ